MAKTDVDGWPDDELSMGDGEASPAWLAAPPSAWARLERAGMAQEGCRSGGWRLALAMGACALAGALSAAAAAPSARWWVAALAGCIGGFLCATLMQILAERSVEDEAARAAAQIEGSWARAGLDPRKAAELADSGCLLESGGWVGPLLRRGHDRAVHCLPSSPEPGIARRVALEAMAWLGRGQFDRRRGGAYAPGPDHGGPRCEALQAWRRAQRERAEIGAASATPAGPGSKRSARL